ncbi:MAG: DNA polymerase Y family protein [Pseudomonadota bacterium]
MSRRYVSLWLPHWPIDRFRLAARRAGEPTHDGRPLALLHERQGVPRLYAVAPEAAASKLSAGASLADARAICPELLVAPAAVEHDLAALKALALWCGRYGPWVALDGDDGIIMDITGCAHLQGGEASLMGDLEARLTPHGLKVRTAAASNPAAAWAWARFGAGGVLGPARHDAAMAALPTAALRLDPATVQGLVRLGLRRVAEVAAMPAAPLINRFGSTPIERLHLLLGRVQVPFTPFVAPARHTARLSWAEPVATTEGLHAALADATAALCRQLDSTQEGVRHLALDLARLDGAVHHLTARTSKANRDPAALVRLFTDALDGLDVGFGIECLRLAAIEVERLTAHQLATVGGEGGEGDAEAAAARLVDRLAGRLGSARVQRLHPVDSHLPERAQRAVPALQVPASLAPWPLRPPRPLRLLDEPRALGAIAAVPDGAPVRLRLGQISLPVSVAEGPERIAAEWWREPDAEERDYFRVQLQDGRRWWVRREGRYGTAHPPRWTLDGVFT